MAPSCNLLNAVFLSQGSRGQTQTATMLKDVFVSVQ